MKIPSLAYLLLAPLLPAAPGGDRTESPSPRFAVQSAAATPVAGKATPTPAAPAPAPATRDEKPRRAPGSRPPAHLFM
jgi:hypothetical protein